jgi:hypothetical protein
VNGLSSAVAHAAKNAGKINATNGATRIGQEDLRHCRKWATAKIKTGQ